MCSVGTNELTIDQGYYSTSPSQQLQYCTAVNSAQTTPNTPSSIPDIVLTGKQLLTWSYFVITSYEKIP